MIVKSVSEPLADIGHACQKRNLAFLSRQKACWAGSRQAYSRAATEGTEPGMKFLGEQACDRTPTKGVRSSQQQCQEDGKVFQEGLRGTTPPSSFWVQAGMREDRSSSHAPHKEKLSSRL